MPNLTQLAAYYSQQADLKLFQIDRSNLNDKKRRKRKEREKERGGSTLGMSYGGLLGPGSAEQIIPRKIVGPALKY